MRGPLAGVLLASLALGPAGCGGDEEAGGARPPANVEAVVARLDTIRVRIRSVGSLEADQRVRVSAESSGRVSEILFTEGQTVSRGQVLLRLDREKLEAGRAAAEAAVTRARREAENLERQVERNRGLLESGAISEQAFDDLETRWEAARSRLEEAEAQLALAGSRLEDATIRAPFAGRVGAREVDVGAYLAPGDPLFVVVDNDPLEIDFTVPERYLARLAVGRPLTLAVSSFPDRTFLGEVTFVSPVVDPQNRTVTLKGEIPNPEEELRAGQFANVDLELETRPSAVVLPEEAIVPVGGERFVFLVREGRAVRRPVKIGVRGGGAVEIAEGVAAGDTVVVAGQQRISDGSPVAPNLRPAEPLEPPVAADGEGSPDEGGDGEAPPADAETPTGPEGGAGGPEASGVEAREPTDDGGPTGTGG